MKTVLTKRFSKQLDSFLRGNKKYESKIIKTMSLVDFDLKHPSLRLHKISGEEVYSVSVDKKIRILLTIDGENIHLLEIGNHDQVY